MSVRWRTLCAPLALLTWLALPLSAGCGARGGDCVTGSPCACPDARRGVRSCAVDGTAAACRCAASGELPPPPPGMALVPGGTFPMGSTTGFPDEMPVHQVRVESFYLDVEEVTVAEYRQCSDTGRCTPLGRRAAWPEIFPDERESWSQFCNANLRNHDDHPANCVEWSQADTYCRVHGWRLPTEEEFEYAARGGSEARTYPWGEQALDETRLNACGSECQGEISRIRGGWQALYPGSDGYAGTSPVGSFPAGRGRWGHSDLAGNVWEWTSTLYCRYDDAGCFSDQRVVRGSGFLQTNAIKARATRRNQDTEWHVSGDSGFRCATSIGPNPRANSSAPSFTLMHQRPDSARAVVLMVLSLLTLVLTGAVLGLLGGGGSVLTLPTMLLVVGLEPITASAMSVIVMTATAPVSALAHARRGNVRLGLALPFGLLGSAGAFAGARLAQLVPSPILLAGFVVVMLVTARAMLRRRKNPLATVDESAAQPLWKRALLVLGGGVVGMLSGLLGVGGGFLIVPVFTLLGRIPMPVAVGTSAVVIAMNSLSGVIGQRAFAFVDWHLAIAFSVASALGTLVGSLFTHRVAPEKLRRWFGVLVVVAGMLVLTRQALPGLRDLLRSRSGSHVAPTMQGAHG